jgi:hypothetical protein
VAKHKYIETPDKLLQLFYEYVKDTKLKPFLVHDFVGKDAEEVWKEKQRPLSWVGFECYLFEQDIISDLSSYEQNRDNSYVEYLPIINVCKKFIERDQFEGATAGVFNPNIIARKLGLADKQEVKHDVYDVKLNL